MINHSRSSLISSHVLYGRYEQYKHCTCTTIRYCVMNKIRQSSWKLGPPNLLNEMLGCGERYLNGAVDDGRQEVLHGLLHCRKDVLLQLGKLLQQGQLGGEKNKTFTFS